MLSLLVGHFHIFGIFRVEAVIIVQLYEAFCRQWRNFRLKMAVGLRIFVPRAIFAGKPRCSPADKIAAAIHFFNLLLILTIIYL